MNDTGRFGPISPKITRFRVGLDTWRLTLNTSRDTPGLAAFPERPTVSSPTQHEVHPAPDN